MHDMNYCVLEIAGKQYLAEPEKDLLVGFLGDAKEHRCDKVLLMSDGGKIEVGTPYLKMGVLLNVVGTKRDKVRVATYHAKANTRKVVGFKDKKSVVRMSKALLRTKSPVKKS